MQAIRRLVSGLMIVLAILLFLIALVGFLSSDVTDSRIAASAIACIAVGLLLLRRKISTNAVLRTTSAQNEALAFVRVTPAGEIHVEARSVPEIKGALQELRLLRKSLASKKRLIVERQQVIRAGYTHDMRHQGSKVRGGRGVGRFVRLLKTMSRDVARRQLAQNLRPLEDERQATEVLLARIDLCSTQLETSLATS